MNKSPRSLFLHRKSGFSLVEMIGVLAIIAILAVVIVPKVFSTIAASRVTNAVGSINSIKTAVAEFAGKYGTVPLTDNESRIDDLLLKAGMLDSRFTVKLGTAPSGVAGDTWTNNNGTWTKDATGTTQTSQSRILSQTSTTTVPSSAGGRNYKLDGVNDLAPGSIVVSAVLLGVTANDARELSLRIDGDAASESTTATADARGKVVYGAGTGTKTVYIYLAHQ